MTRVGTTVAIPQQPEKYHNYFPSDLSRYCHFGEALLTPSRVVDTSTKYLCRYAVGAFVAIMCTNKSGRTVVHMYMAPYQSTEGGSVNV